MKKTLIVIGIAASVASAALLTGCAKHPTEAEQPKENITVRSISDDASTPVPIPLPNPAPRIRFNISGVRRHFKKSLAGEYSVEYIHSNDDVDLDCNLTVNRDHSYEMRFIKNGNTVEHSGNWYSRHGNVTFFFDEDKPTYVPEVYYPDSISADIIDGGRLMMYDSNCVIVLSHNKTAENNG